MDEPLLTPGGGSNDGGPSLDVIARDAGLHLLSATSTAEEVRDRLHAFATVFAHADAEQREAAKRHASLMMRTAGIRGVGGAIHAAFAAAADRAARSVDACVSNSEKYAIERGSIVRRKATKLGVVTERLANFAAHIVEETVIDDGIEPTLAFTIGGALATGEPLPTVCVPVARYGSLQWIGQWGARAIITAGSGARDALREAIQELSPSVSRRHVCAHTGWRQINAGWGYLTCAGAVGYSGFQVNLEPELARYALPLEPRSPVDAVRTSLALLQVAPFRITVPLLATIFRAPLAHALAADYTLWLEGQTGSLKSTLAALFLCHYGQFTRTQLPGNWSSTANHLEKCMSVLKDTVFVIDDWVPTPLDAHELEAKASRVVRAQGNAAGRGRLRSDLSGRPVYRPRGVTLSTGEHHPPGHSLLGRLLVVEIKLDQVDLIALTRAQESAALLPNSMSAFIHWLRPQMDQLPNIVQTAFNLARAKAEMANEHLRLPEIVAHNWIGFDAALRFAVEIGACSIEEADQLRLDGWQALIDCATAQTRLLESERPTTRFLEVLTWLLDQERAILLSTHDGGVQRDPRFIGWRNVEYLFLEPQATFAAITRACRELGEPFPVTKTALAAALRREGLTECDRTHNSKVIRVRPKPCRVWALRAAALSVAEDLPAAGT